MTLRILSGGELVYEPWPWAGDWHMFSGNVEDFRNPQKGMLDPDHVWRTQRNVRTVVGYLARNFAQVRLLPYRIRDDGERERIRRPEPIAVTLSAPDGPTVTEYDYSFARMVDLCLWDRYAAIKLWDPDGRLRLKRLPPRRWRFLRNDDDQPYGVRILSGSHVPDDEKFIDVDLRWVDWLDGYPVKSNGYSPMEFLADLLTEEAESSACRIDMWRNGARISGVIERPMDAPKWEKPQRDAFVRRWREAYTIGGSRRGTRMGGTPVLEDGMVFKQMKAITPEQAEQIESRQLSKAEVAAAFFVAPELIGAREGTYSNVEAYRQGLYSETLGPAFMQTKQAYDARVVPDFGDPDEIYVEHNVQEKLRMSFEEQARIGSTVVGAPTMTRNEWRRLMNLPDLPGDEGNEIVTPLNVLIGGQANPTDSRPDLRALPSPDRKAR